MYNTRHIIMDTPELRTRMRYAGLDHHDVEALMYMGSATYDLSQITYTVWKTRMIEKYDMQVITLSWNMICQVVKTGNFILKYSQLSNLADKICSNLKDENLKKDIIQNVESILSDKRSRI